jgi:hypothetical protein
MSVRRAALVLGLLIPATVRAATYLTFDSDPGDYIGAGVARTWRPSDGTFTALASGGGVDISFAGGTDTWSLTFVPASR